MYRRNETEIISTSDNVKTVANKNAGRVDKKKSSNFEWIVNAFRANFRQFYLGFD